MIKAVVVKNYRGEELRLTLRRPDSQGLVVADIRGLGPVKSNIYINDLAGQAGGLYVGSRPETRNIVMTLVYQWAPTIQDARRRVYKYMPVGHEIEFKVETTDGDYYTKGYVESDEPNIFSPASSTAVSIICPDPYWRLGSLEDYQITPFFGVKPMFEFPFSNEEGQKQLVMGEIMRHMEVSLYYQGDSPTGGILHLQAVGGGVRDVTIVNLTTDVSVVLKDYTIPDGTEVLISSIPGDLYARTVVGRVPINLLDNLQDRASWMTVNPGDNRIVVGAASGINNLVVTFENPVLKEGL